MVRTCSSSRLGKRWGADLLFTTSETLMGRRLLSKSSSSQSTRVCISAATARFHHQVSVLPPPAHLFRNQQQRCHFSTEAAPFNAIDTPQIVKWSKQRLAKTTRPEQMKLVVKDVAVRLGRQCDLLEELHQLTQNLLLQQKSSSATATSYTGNEKVIYASMTHDWWSKSDDRLRLQRSHALETVSKNLQDLQRLHRDTQLQCQQYHDNMPDYDGDTATTSSISPLFQRQLGQACKEIYARHALTIETMAEIVIDLRGILVDAENIPETMIQVHSIVTTFLKSRLMTQLLCDHVVDCMMHSERKPNGAISVDVPIADLVQSAVTEARHLVEVSFIHIADDAHHQVEDPPEPPLVHIMEEEDEDNVKATLVRPWFQYALVELLKNSLAVTMERNRRTDPHSHYWPLYIRIYETRNHVVVELLDQGGGLSWQEEEITNGQTNNDKNKQPKDWFEFANRRDKWDRLADQQTYAMVSSPIRGLGVGLALSRLHLRQFGGELTLEDRPESSKETMGGVAHELQSGLTATLLLAKNFDRIETDIYS